MNGVRPFSHEVGTWTQGYEAGVRRARRDARVEAFGAIRRAAKVARKADRESETLRIEEFDLQSARIAAEARGMRRAIRAAIGSAKA